MLGSIPSAFCGVLLVRSFGSGNGLQSLIKDALGVALLVVVGGLLIRPILQRNRPAEPQAPLKVLRLPTLIIGVSAGWWSESRRSAPDR